MTKPEISMENGMLLVKAGIAIDSDKDGVAAGKVQLAVELNAAEVVAEIAKKDMPLVEMILKQVKI